jgi:hypothetical protein
VSQISTRTPKREKMLFKYRCTGQNYYYRTTTNTTTTTTRLCLGFKSLLYSRARRENLFDREGCGIFSSLNEIKGHSELDENVYTQVGWKSLHSRYSGTGDSFPRIFWFFFFFPKTRSFNLIEIKLETLSELSVGMKKMPTRENSVRNIQPTPNSSPLTTRIYALDPGFRFCCSPPSPFWYALGR